MLEAIEDESLDRIHTAPGTFPFQPMGLANLLKGFARLDYRPGSILPLAYARAAKTIQHYQPTEMSNLMYACARFGQTDRQLVSSIIREVIRRRGEGKSFSEGYIRSIYNSCRALEIDAAELLIFLDDKWSMM